MSTTPIADHALLSDCHSAALVDRAGSVEWWCAPRFDSPSLFARLLDDRAGHFSIRPAGDARVERRYVEYGSSFEATRVFGMFRGLYDLVYNLNLGHLSHEVSTVFQHPGDAAIRTACVGARHQPPTSDSSCRFSAATRRRAARSGDDHSPAM